MAARKYDASSISVLNEMEGVRANPGMYLGDVDANGTFQCFKEIVDNANDEMNECGGGHIRIIIRGSKVIVADQGRGIPVEKHPKTKLSTIETVLTKLHAGGKNIGKSAYGSRTFGVHGVGASVVNALCLRLHAHAFRDGKWHTITFESGVVTQPLHQSDGPPIKWAKGTVIEYELDPKYLPEPLNLTSVRRRCGIMRHFSKVTIDLSLKAGHREKLEPRKPEDMLTGALKDTEVLLGPFSIRANGVALVAAWTTAPDARINAHVAGASVPAGTHVLGLEDAARDAIRSLASGKSAKSDVDGTVGLVAVLDVDVDQPSFSGQAKSALKTASVRKRVADAVRDVMVRLLKKNRDAAAKIVEHSATVARMDRDHKERRSLAKVAGVSSRGRLNLPKNLVAALAYPASQRELYICEGDSAKGTSEDAKMPWQEILGIRGKLPNTFKRKKEAMLNERIADVIQSVGYDSRFPDRPPRVSKVILLTDADDDGDHISVLLLALHDQKMLEILRKGMVYITEAPLFEAMNSKGEMVSGDSLQEIERAHGKVTHVNRMKGWGGCPVPLLREVAFNPATRRIRRIAPPTDQDRAEFALLMGDDTAARKELLGANVSEAKETYEADHDREISRSRVRGSKDSRTSANRVGRKRGAAAATQSSEPSADSGSGRRVRAGSR